MLNVYFGSRIGEPREETILKRNYNIRDISTMFWFKCEKIDEHKVFYEGSIRCGFNNSEEKCCFYTVDTIECATSLFDCHLVSEKFSIPGVIKIRGLGLNENRESENNNNNIFVAYDIFDAELNQQWILDNSVLWHDRKWWIRQLIRILWAMEFIESNNIPLGVLEFVVRGDNIYLKNVGVPVSSSGEKLFKKFVKDGAFRCLNGDPEWDNFLKAIDTYSANQLLKHPMLLDELERYNLFREIGHHYSLGMTKTQKESFKAEMNKSKEYKGWPLEDPMLKRMHTNKIDKRSEQIRYPSMLLDFIENIFDHYWDIKNIQERGADEEVIESREALGDKIYSTYRGYLSFMHNILVQQKAHFTGKLSKIDVKVEPMQR